MIILKRNSKGVIVPQRFGLRGPKSDEEYIEVPAHNMISIYIWYIYIPDEFKFFKFFARKENWWVISQSGGGNSTVYLRF